MLPSLNATARTLTGEAEVQNATDFSKPGAVRNRSDHAVTAGERPSWFRCPPSKAEGDTNKVYVIKDGVAHERLVQTGLLEGDTIQIKQGLQKAKSSPRRIWAHFTTASMGSGVRAKRGKYAVVS